MTSMCELHSSRERAKPCHGIIRRRAGHRVRLPCIKKTAVQSNITKMGTSPARGGRFRCDRNAAAVEAVETARCKSTPCATLRKIRQKAPSSVPVVG
jgi:hypothetical protein